MSLSSYTRIAAGWLAMSAPALTAADVPLSAESTVKQVVVDLPSYAKLTPEPVSVNPFLAMLCRGASKNEIEKERTRHGPHTHSMIEIRMNPLAAAAFKAGSTNYPTGAVVVKSKSYFSYVTEAGKMETPVKNGIGGMIKRSAGYDPQYGDWEYFFISESGKIENGRMVSCKDCHNKAKATDFVFGSWSRPAIPAELLEPPKNPLHKTK